MARSAGIFSGYVAQDEERVLELKMVVDLVAVAPSLLQNGNSTFSIPYTDIDMSKPLSPSSRYPSNKRGCNGDSM